MKKFFTKNKKYLGLILIAVIAFNFLFLPLAALAQATGAGAGAAQNKTSWLDKLIGFVSGGSLLFISSFISSLLGTLFGAVLYIEGLIIDYLISPANFSLTNADVVKTGWGITRDLANMFFILILLIIAFATVLKIQSYSIKQLWWKVLAAAVLINFSLVIAGFVIDFAQVLTTFFLNGITGGSIGTVTTRLASSMQILNFYNPANPGDIEQGIAQFTSSGIAAVIGILLTLVGLVVMVFVFGATAIFLIVRILYIWFLLIVAPIVWMLWIMPSTSKYFSQWWDKFIQWTFFAPIYLFMIYLSLSIFEVNGKFKAGNFLTNTSQAWNNALKGGLTTATMPSAIFQWILVIAMMFGSLIVAQKFGVEGATGARKILTGWGTDTKNWAGRQLRRQALGVGAKEAAPGVAARPGLLVRGAQKLAAVPGGRLISGQIFKMQAGEAATIADAQKQFSSWTSEGIQQYLRRSPGPITNALFRNQQIGAAMALKDKGDLDTLDEDRLRELAALASRMYSKKELREILKAAPHLAPEFNEDMRRTVGKIEKASQVIMKSLKDINVVAYFSPEQFKDIQRNGSDQKVEQTKNTVDSAIGGLRKANKAMADRVESVAAITNRDRRNKELRELSQFNEFLGKLAQAKFTTNSPAWDI